MAALLVRLVKQRAGKKNKQIPTNMKVEERIVKMDDSIGDIGKIGKPSQYTCPECSGTLYELHEGPNIRYRCRTGHGFGMMSLMAEQRTYVEDALWTAMRAMREKSELLSQRARSKNESERVRKKLDRLAVWTSRQADNIRNMIETIEGEKG
jgi:two-component system chemotaxis response regulator CheB